MKRTLIILLLAATVEAQQSTQDPEKLRQQQQQQQQELLRAQRERLHPGDRRPRLMTMAARNSDNVAMLAAPQRTEGCLAQAMPPDPSVDLQTIPLSEWLANGEATQISLKVQIEKPELRMDQRYEIAYYGSIETKDLPWPGDSEELIYVSGISTPDGEWVIPPKIGRQVFESKSASEPQVLFGDCLFVRPGDYSITVVVYDTHSGKHSLAKKRIRPSDFSDELLPVLNSTLPVALFPMADGPDPRSPEMSPPRLLISVANKRPLDVSLIGVVSASDQWAERPDFIRATNNRVLAGMSVLSQMKLENGSISAFALDLVNRVTRFEQRDLRQLDWSTLAGTFPKAADASKVTLDALQNRKERGVFLRKTLSDRLDQPGDALRVFVIVSGSVTFESGSDLSPVVVKGDCRCRIYHLRFRVTMDDSYDDLEKLLKRLHSKTFDIQSAHDLRYALAEIVHDLEIL
jgi:hypothetical protein